MKYLVKPVVIKQLDLVVKRYFIGINLNSVPSRWGQKKASA